MSEPLDRSLHGVEFTRRWYRGLLGQLQSDGYRFRSFDDRPTEGDVILRHDVDLSVEAALAMARVETDLGIESTYFFLLTSPLYNLFERDTRERVREIESLGHDVGVHFSTHQYWPPDAPPADDDLARRVGREQSVLAELVDEPASTVSFHIPPSWVLDRSYEDFRSAYEPAFFTEIDYVADSSQRWRDDHPLDGGLPETVQLLTHPGLWGETDAGFEERVERAAAESCRHALDRTRREFIEGVYDR